MPISFCSCFFLCCVLCVLVFSKCWGRNGYFVKYRKPTSTDILITSESNKPTEHKISAIRYLQDRNNTYPTNTIGAALSPYGEVKEVLEDTWSKAYPYKVYNGVRIAATNLKHLPSHMIIAGTRDSRPRFYGCNEQGHLNQDCLRRRQNGTQHGDTYKHSWANVVTQGPMRQQTATMRDAAPSQQSIHEVRMTDILTELPSRQEDH